MDVDMCVGAPQEIGLSKVLERGLCGKWIFSQSIHPIISLNGYTLDERPSRKLGGLNIFSTW